MAMKNPPHPGLSVRHDCLEPLGLTVTGAAKLLGVTRQTLNDLVSFLGIACPVDSATARLNCLFELLEQFWHAGGDIFLNCGTSGAQLLPIIQLFYSARALLTNGGSGMLQVVALGGVV